MAMMPAVASYRLGMVVYSQGPDRFADAKSLLEAGKAVDTRSSSLLANARNDINAALKVIREYEAEQARLAREAEKAAQAQKREEDRAKQQLNKLRKAAEAEQR